MSRSLVHLQTRQHGGGVQLRLLVEWHGEWMNEWATLPNKPEGGVSPPDKRKQSSETQSEGTSLVAQ